MTPRWPALAEHLEKIPYFVAIAKAGSLQQAARDLRIAQPSLTKSMHLLEEALQASLFRRSRTGMTLTPAGAEFRLFAEPLLSSLARVERQVRDVAGAKAAGVLRLGTHELLVREFWPTLVLRVRKTMPRVNLTLFTHPSVGELTRRLGAAELDVVVCVECSPTPTLVREEIRDDCYGFYATPAFLRSHELNTKSRLTLAALGHLPLIYAPEVIAGPGTKLGAALQAAGLDSPPLYAVHSLESVFALVEGGLGLGILPHRMVDSDKRTKLKGVRAPGFAGGRLGRHRLFTATTLAGVKEGRIREVMNSAKQLLQ